MSAKKKIGVRKSFRLFDFNVYDEDQTLAKETFDSDDSGDDKYNSFKEKRVVYMWKTINLSSLLE
jgi:hypothetical protein